MVDDKAGPSNADRRLKPGIIKGLGQTYIDRLRRTRIETIGDLADFGTAEALHAHVEELGEVVVPLRAIRNAKHPEGDWVTQAQRVGRKTERRPEQEPEDGPDREQKAEREDVSKQELLPQAEVEPELPEVATQPTAVVGETPADAPAGGSAATQSARFNIKEFVVTKRERHESYGDDWFEARVRVVASRLDHDSAVEAGLPFLCEIVAVDEEGGCPQVLSAAMGNLEPETLESDETATFRAPDVGIHRLYAIAWCPRLGRHLDLADGPRLTVTEWTRSGAD